MTILVLTYDGLTVHDLEGEISLGSIPNNEPFKAFGGGLPGLDIYPVNYAGSLAVTVEGFKSYQMNPSINKIINSVFGPAYEGKNLYACEYKLVNRCDYSYRILWAMYRRKSEKNIGVMRHESTRVWNTRQFPSIFNRLSSRKKQSA